MKRIIFFMFAFVFVFTSCHKEEISFDRKEVIDPPTELDYAIFSGEILNNNKGVADAEIFIYQKGKNLGNVVSDQNGKYTTEGHSIEIGSDVTFEVKTEKYETKIIRKSVSQISNDKNDFQLHLKSNKKFLFSELSNPGDTNLVKIYGTLTDKNSKPIENVLVIVGSKEENKIYFDFSDRNGCFQVLVKKNVELYIYTRKGDCGFCLNRNDFLLFENDEFTTEIIGKITSDFEFIEQPDIEINSRNIKVNGRFLDCEGNPISTATASLEIRINDDDGWVLFGKHIDVFDQNGRFVIDFNTCFQGDIFLRLVVRDSLQFGDYLLITYQGGIIDIGTIYACTDLSTYDKYLKIKIGDIYYVEDILCIGNANWDVKLSGIKDSKKIIKLKIDKEIKVGNTYFVNEFIFDEDNPWGFNAEYGEIKTNILRIDNGCVHASFEGVTSTNEYGIQKVTGQFTLCEHL